MAKGLMQTNSAGDDEKKPRARKRIKDICIRCNREILPFQHIRVEVHATISKEDDADEVAKEVERQLEESICRVAKRIYDKIIPVEEDDLPY